MQGGHSHIQRVYLMYVEYGDMMRNQYDANNRAIVRAIVLQTLATKMWCISPPADGAGVVSGDQPR